MIVGNRLRLSVPPTATASRHHSLLVCQLTKQGDRFLSSVAAEEPSAAVGLIRKFVASSSKHVAISTLTHLLSHPRLSSLAFPMYSVMKQEPWFCWNAKTVADLIALLYKDERFDEADELFAETVAKLGFRERDLCVFYRNLMDSQGKYKSERGVSDCCAQLRLLISQSSSVYVKQKGYESMVVGFCEIGLPDKAEDLIEEMREKGLQPSGFEFKSLIYGYGRNGFLQDMKRIIDQMETEGFELDTVCCNMVLSSFGAHNKLAEMLSWLIKMRTSGIGSSIRTYNSVLNYCPTIVFLQQDAKNVPLSINELLRNLTIDEANLVKELSKSSIFDVVMEWNSSEVKLDLHGMHLGSAYLVLLQWFNEMKVRFAAGDCESPAEILVVCGYGKHSCRRGESPVKDLVKEMVKRTSCPLRIDSKNIGCFIGKGRKFKNWLELDWHR